MVSNRLKYGALLAFVISMAVLLIGGLVGSGKLAPYFGRVLSPNGDELADKAAIYRGQSVYQKYGLMDHGSIWGHGTLRGMDFAAHSLNLIGRYMRDYYSQERYQTSYDNLNYEQKSVVDATVIREIKTNTYDQQVDTLKLSPAQNYTLSELQKYWDELFANGDPDYGFLPNTVKTSEERKDLATFLFWTAWVAGTNRPGTDMTYTNNWPGDESVGNRPPTSALTWSILSITALLVILGLVIFVVHRYRFFYGEPEMPHLGEALAASPITPSQKKAAKFFLVVGLLFILQILVGGLLAHYTVHPGSFYLKFVGKFVTYSWAKTWHLQLAILWIATAWIGSSLYIAPIVGGKEPRRQGLLVDILFVAVLIVALGSLISEPLSLKGKLSGDWWYWLGHQGWEYIELGRIWQILLFVGLLVWLVIAYRALKPRLTKEGNWSGLTHLYTYSAILVVLFFGFGLFYNRGTHLSMADYWRWFVVHIWVEGMFEFFAAAAIALLLSALGLVSKEAALRAAYLTAILAFSAGIIGTSHHYFWFGMPSFWLALGAVFSSLEPIPLILLVVRAWMEHRSTKETGKDYPYRWPLMFLIASSFWNFLGAGVFGFIINTPIINYYEHATYLTSNHAHTALFGTYGMLAIGLILFAWRGMVKEEHWNNTLAKVSFYGLNVGLALMFLMTLFPIGLMQVIASYSKGFWYARSAAFYNQTAVQVLGQIRLIPDLIIIVFGAIPLAILLFGTFLNLKKPEIQEGETTIEDLPI